MNIRGKVWVPMNQLSRRENSKQEKSGSSDHNWVRGYWRLGATDGGALFREFGNQSKGGSFFTRSSILRGSREG